MPIISRFMIKCAFAWLLIALALGVAQSAGMWPAGRIAIFHVLTVGWLTQLIFGVAYWLFPRWSKEAPYGPKWAGWAAFLLINGGVVVRTIGSTAAWGETAGGITQLAGILAITAVIWPRVRKK